MAAGLWCGATAATDASAGAFNPPAGRGLAIVTASFAGADVFHDGAGRRIRAPAYRKFELQAHLEYGVTDWLAVIARPRLSSVTTDHARPIEANGLGASEIGVQARLWAPGDWSFAAQVLARTPAAPKSGFEDGGGVEARLMSGRRFALFGFPAFAETHVAVRSRKGRADEALVDTTFGVRVLPTVLVMSQSFVTQSLESPRRAWRRGAPLGSGHMKAQLAVVVDIARDWSIGAAVYRTLTARDASMETGASLSAWRRF